MTLRPATSAQVYTLPPEIFALSTGNIGPLFCFYNSLFFVYKFSSLEKFCRPIRTNTDQEADRYDQTRPDFQRFWIYLPAENQLEVSIYLPSRFYQDAVRLSRSTNVRPSVYLSLFLSVCRRNCFVLEQFGVKN